MVAFYNEFDPKAAAWLRELIARGLIADGVVDTRSVEDLEPRQLAGYTQVHLFAGIGVWSYALRQAGVSDDTPVWTMSCPCQPFSAAGKGDGFDDERHLWPAAQWLIEQRRPQLILGEQVASKDAEPWLDLVQADLEGLDYAFGACAFPSAGVGAPHIRDRSYWVADAAAKRSQWGARAGRKAQHRVELGSGAIWLANNNNTGLEGRGQPGRERGNELAAGSGGLAGGLADADGGDEGEHGLREVAPHAGPVNGFWRDADWIYCRNGEWRPVEPGAFPLAHGAPARVGRLRGYGNAINAEAATVFIQSYLEARS